QPRLRPDARRQEHPERGGLLRFTDAWPCMRPKRCAQNAQFGRRLGIEDLIEELEGYRGSAVIHGLRVRPESTNGTKDHNTAGSQACLRWFGTWLQRLGAPLPGGSRRAVDRRGTRLEPNTGNSGLPIRTDPCGTCRRDPPD